MVSTPEFGGLDLQGAIIVDISANGHTVAACRYSHTARSALGKPVRGPRRLAN